MESFITISSLLSAQNHFVIPDYQREYSWGKTENLTLWNDLVDLVADKGKRHFLGALVTSKYQKQDASLSIIRPEQFGISQSDVVHVLDGQQRLTSISVLIAALIDVIKQDLVIQENKKELLKSHLEDLLYDDDFTDGDEQTAPRLFLKEESGKYYYKDILGLDVSEKPRRTFKAVKNISSAYELYKTKIDEWNTEINEDSRIKRYNRLIKTVRDRVQVVNIACADGMNEFQVFESLNGKGLNLTAIDRIKSIYLSRARVSNASGATNWQRLYSKINVGAESTSRTIDNKRVLHFFTSFFFYRKGLRVSKIDLPNAFKQMCRDELQGFNALDAELQEAAHRYGALRGAVTNSQVDDVLRQIAQLGQEQVYVPLYAAATQYGINSEELKYIADSILRYSVRFIVCGKPSNTLDSEFSKIIEKIKMGSVDDVKSYIVSRMEDDDEFKNCFANYSTKNSGFATYLLRRIEQALRLKNQNGNPLPADVTLEHIIPQTLDYTKWYGEGSEPEPAIQDSYVEDVVCSIGNMVLLNKNDNSSASNRDYAVKSKIYRNGSTHVEDYGTPANTYELVKELLSDYPNRFGHEEVRERARHLAQMVPSIWPIE